MGREVTRARHLYSIYEMRGCTMDARDATPAESGGDSAVADDPVHSVIKEQVEMGVAVRMAVLDTLARQARRND